MSIVKFSKFEARVLVEGPFTSNTPVLTPASLLELALQHALLSMPSQRVADLVSQTTSRMLHSLSCTRRVAGETVRLVDEDPDGHNGEFQIAIGRGEPEECQCCGNQMCQEWPTLFELDANGAPTGDFAYHISECQMQDCQTGSGQ
jgi:hypothetical protein